MANRLRPAALILSVIVLGAVAFLVWWVAGRGGGRFRGATADASVLLITVDTLRADRIGAYGGPVATPAMDGLARRGVLFENAITPAVMTLPSHASILTGMNPPAHGIRDNGDYRLADGALTLAEVLRSRGMRTGAVVASFVLDSMFGLDQGFEQYDDALPARSPNEAFLAERRGESVTDAAVRYLRGVTGSRFFLWVHYFDPHHPYAAPEDHARRYPGSPYDAEISWVDSEIGRLIESADALGMMDKTLVVLVADHGEGLGDHGEDSHGVFLYEEAARVPMILSFPPWLPPGRRVAGVVSTVDLMPTILDLVRIDPDQAAPAVEGIPLWPLIASEAPLPGRPVYLEAMAPLLMYGWSPLQAIRGPRYKYIEAPRPELYDLSADPGETNNLAATLPDVAADHRSRLLRLIEDSERGAIATEPTALDPEARARLESLGYAAGGATGSGTGARPDPKDKVDLLGRINRVYVAFGAGRYAAALREAQGILAQDPDNGSVKFYAAGSLARLGRWPEALDVFESILAGDPKNTEVLANIGWCQMNMQRFEESEATYRRILEIYPQHVHAESSLGNLAFVKGDYVEAARIYKEVLAREPNHMPSLLTLAGMYEGGERFREAEILYEQVVEVAPGHLEAWMNLGWVRFRQGNHEEALEALREAAGRDPDVPELQIALGDVHLALGQGDEARDAYTRALAMDETIPAAHYGLGLIALQGGDPQEAVARLRRAVALRPDRADWREPLAGALARAGDRAAAALELERYLGSGAVPPDRVEVIRRRIREYRGAAPPS